MTANLRAVAATCCYQVVDQGKSLSDVLPKAQFQFPLPADKALLQEICFGVLRYLPQLDFVCQQLMAKPLIKQLRPLQFLIYVGIYQLKFLRIPDHAAVGETVEAARYLKGQSMTKLINGVLRSVQRKPELFDVSQAPMPVQTRVRAKSAAAVRRMPFPWCPPCPRCPAEGHGATGERPAPHQSWGWQRCWSSRC